MDNNRVISYEDFKTSVCRRALNVEFADVPRKEVLAYLEKEEPYIRDMYESATSVERYQRVYGKNANFQERLERFKRGDFLESDISGTVYGLGMMY